MNTARPTGQHGVPVDPPQRRLAGSIPAINRPTSTGAPSTFYERDPAGTLIAQRSNAGEFYYYLDGLGSVLGLIDTNGTVQASYTYDPYRVTTAVGGPNGNLANTNPYRYASGYLDTATGLYQFGQRYYQPTLGRWTQQDSLSHIGDLNQADRYTWAAGDPVNNMDPSGRSSFSVDVHGCYGLCLDVSASYDPNSGDVGIGGNVGVGSPGVGGGASVSSADVGTGADLTGSCSAGPVTVSQGLTSGMTDVSAGTALSTPSCSVTAGGTYGLGSVH